MAFGLLIGCSGSGGFEGSWEGRKKLPPMPDVDPSISGTLAKVKLTVRGDRGFFLIDGGVPKEGTIRMIDGAPHLVVEKFVSQRVPPEKQEKLKIARSDAGITLSLADGEVVLKPLARFEP